MRLNYIDNCDCLEGLKALPDGSVDVIITDPPYGTTRNAWDSVVPFEPLWAQFNRVIKDDGAIVLFSQQPFTSALINSASGIFRYEWIWEKTTATGHLNAKKMPLKKHENICVFYKKLPTYNPQYTPGKPYTQSSGKPSSNYGKQKDSTVTVNDGVRYPTSILTFKAEKGLHPTQKPVPLIEYLIRTYTNHGDVVLDPFMGSGTTATACLRSGRNFVGFELNEEYHAIAQNRIAEEIDKMLTEAI